MSRGYKFYRYEPEAKSQPILPAFTEDLPICTCTRVVPELIELYMPIKYYRCDRELLGPRYATVIEGAICQECLNKVIVDSIKDCSSLYVNCDPSDYPIPTKDEYGTFRIPPHFKDLTR
jgi:hypothetical protein